MKKLFVLGMASLSLATLTACQSLDAAIKGEDYVASSQQAEQLAQRLETLNQADFPQLSTTVADNEAQVKLVTSMGDITIKLFPEYAPLAVENFLTHAKEGYYDGLTFHRVIADFMIQSGDPNGDGTGGQSIWEGKDSSIDPGTGFANEVSDYLYHIRGALSMANAGPDTNGSQFFIVQSQTDYSSRLDTRLYPEKIIEAYTEGGYPSLDGSYTVFGQVTDGMDIVDKISAVETDSSDKPTSPVTIEKIKIIKDYSFK